MLNQYYSLNHFEPHIGYRRGHLGQKSFDVRHELWDPGLFSFVLKSVLAIPYLNCAS